MADEAWADLLREDAQVQAKAQQRCKLSSISKSNNGGGMNSILGRANKKTKSKPNGGKSKPRKSLVEFTPPSPTSSKLQPKESSLTIPPKQIHGRSENDEDASTNEPCNNNNNNNNDSNNNNSPAVHPSNQCAIVCVEDLAILRRDVSLVDDPDPSKRIRALRRLDAALFDALSSASKETDARTSQLPPAVLQVALDLTLKPLLKRFADPSEKCRSCAVALLTAFFSNISDVGTCLPYLFPAAMDRCSTSFEIDFENGVVIDDRATYDAKLRGRAVSENSARTEFTHHVHEPSEELRLQLCVLMHTVVHSLTSRSLHSMLSPYLADVVLFFHACARDPFPKLKTLAFQCLGELAVDERLCAVLHLFCPALVRSLMPALRHRHSTVRAACIICIRSLVLCPYKDKYRGGGSEAIGDLVGFREANVIPINAFYGGELRINFFGSLVTDHSPLVRKAVFDTIGVWLTTLLDRWDHAPRLMPFLLTALTDQCDEIVQSALVVLNTCGQQYEEEHPDRIVEKVQYGVDGGAVDMLNHNAPLPYPWDNSTGTFSSVATGDVASTGGGRDILHRPRLGTRLYVREHCGRFIRPVLAELKDWRSDTKHHAVKLLRVCLVYMEEHIVMEAHLLMRALVDLQSDLDIADQVLDCARVAGRFIMPSVWLSFLEPIVSGADSTFGTEGSRTSRRAHALRVLAAFIEAAKPKTIMQVYTKVAALVSEWDLTAESVESSSVLRPAHAECLEKLLVSANAFFVQGTGTGASDVQYTTSGRLQSLSLPNPALYRTALILAAHAPNSDNNSIINNNTSNTSATAARRTNLASRSGSSGDVRPLLVALGRFGVSCSNSTSADRGNKEDACIVWTHQRFLPELVSFVSSDGVIDSAVGAVREAWRAIQVALTHGGASVMHKDLLTKLIHAAASVFELPSMPVTPTEAKELSIVDGGDGGGSSSGHVPAEAWSLRGVLQVREVVCDCLMSVCLEPCLTSTNESAIGSNDVGGGTVVANVVEILELVFQDEVVQGMLHSIGVVGESQQEVASVRDVGIGGGSDVVTEQAKKRDVHASNTAVVADKKSWCALAHAMVRLVQVARTTLGDANHETPQPHPHSTHVVGDQHQLLWDRIRDVVTLRIEEGQCVNQSLKKWVERQTEQQM